MNADDRTDNKLSNRIKTVAFTQKLIILSLLSGTALNMANGIFVISELLSGIFVIFPKFNCNSRGVYPTTD